MQRKLSACPAVALACFTLLGSAALVTGQRLAQRRGDEPVNGAALRGAPGLHPAENLLFNGWGLTPAGRQTRLNGDMPLKMAVSPDHQTLAVAMGGFSSTGVELLDLQTRASTQFIPLPQAFNGIAFSRDGKQLLVSGAGSGTLLA